MKKLLLALAVVVATAPSSAHETRRTWANRPPCPAGADGNTFLLLDPVDATDCATGGGTAQVHHCTCDNGTWKRSEPDDGHNHTSSTAPSHAGDVTGPHSATVVGNDSHDHTGSTLSGVDISADTNLAVTAPVTLTGDTVGLQALGGDVTGTIPATVVGDNSHNHTSTTALSAADLICTDCISTPEISDVYILNSGGDTASGGTYTINTLTMAPSGSYPVTALSNILASSAAPNIAMRETDAANYEFAVTMSAGNFYVSDLSGGTFPLQIEQGVATNTLVLDSASRIGIKTSAPTATLDVRGGGTLSPTIISEVNNSHSTQSNNVAQQAIQLTNTDTTVNNWQEIAFYSASNGIAGSIGFQVTDHASHLGEFSFATRGPSYQQRLKLGPSTVFNEHGANVDWRVEGDTDANLIFADASTDRVGIGTASPGGKLDVRGAAIFNEDGAAADFRVESDTRTHTLFVDGTGAGKVGIGTSSPAEDLTVSGDILASGMRVGVGTGAKLNLFTVLKGGTESAFYPITPVAVFQDSSSSTSEADVMITAGTAGYARLELGDSSGARQGGMTYNNSADELGLRANGGTKFTLTSTAATSNVKLGADDNSAVGTDPLCWDGSGSSNHGDCTSARRDPETGEIRKKRIRDIKFHRVKGNASSALALVNKLKPRAFRWSRRFGNYDDWGFVAEEVLAVHPQLARLNRETGAVRDVDERALLALLTKAVSDLAAENRALQVRVETMEREIAGLRPRPGPTGVSP